MSHPSSGCFGCGLAESGGDERAAEGLGVAGEVEGGDLGELLFDEDQGAEVEALDFGAGLHLVAGDGSAEGRDEDLRVYGVVGHRFDAFAWGGQVRDGFAWRVVGEWENFGLEVEPDLRCVGGPGFGAGMGFAWTLTVVIGVEAREAEELLGIGGDIGTDEVLLFGEGYGDG